MTFVWVHFCIFTPHTVNQCDGLLALPALLTDLCVLCSGRHGGRPLSELPTPGPGGFKISFPPFPCWGFLYSPICFLGCNTLHCIVHTSRHSICITGFNDFHTTALDLFVCLCYSQNKLLKHYVLPFHDDF